MYRVEENDENVSEIDRSRLRHQKKHLVSCAHVSDEKKHDRFSMQNFYTADLELLEGYTKDQFSNGIPEERVTHLHLNSDNAGQHFNISGAIEYFTSLINDRGGETDCMYIYSLGAPGHGKGFFDSLGGVLKNKINTLIKGSKTGGDTSAGTNSGYISNVKDVHDELK